MQAVTGPHVRANGWEDVELARSLPTIQITAMVSVANPPTRLAFPFIPIFTVAYQVPSLSLSILPFYRRVLHA